MTLKWILSRAKSVRLLALFTYQQLTTAKGVKEENWRIVKGIWEMGNKADDLNNLSGDRLNKEAEPMRKDVMFSFVEIKSDDFVSSIQPLITKVKPSDETIDIEVMRQNFQLQQLQHLKLEAETIDLMPAFD